MMNISAEAPPAVSIRGLRVRRGRRTVFAGIDLDLPAGRVTGLLGPSGGGKTTLIRSIVGVQKVAGGTVTVLGESAGCRQLRHCVAYGTQGAAVYDDLTVEQNLRYFARLGGTLASRIPASEIDGVIARVGLAGAERQLAGALSGGQRSRVSLAVAMLGRPELIILDEPTVGLDPVLRASLWTLFRQLADDGVTLLVSSHVMDEALRCDEIVLLREGRVLAQTTPRAFFDDAGTDDPDSAFLRVIERAEAAASAPSRRKR